MLEKRDPHRVRAFRRVAKAVEMLPEPLSQMLAYGRLGRVRGIGEGALARIKQILRSGSCDDLERLRAKIPPGLRELLQLRGLGATKIRLLHQHLAVNSIDQLEFAARSGRLARLPRMGEQSVAAVLRAIAEHRRLVSRTPLSQALQISESIVEQLRHDANVVRADYVGSARRYKETVGDLDFLVAADDAPAAVAAFCRLEQAAEVITAGHSLASVRLTSGQQADLWTVRPEEYGAGLHAWSGSQVHVVSLRDRANRMGLHISEHGVVRRTDELRLTRGRQEVEIFAAVGLPFITPELREGYGEIDAAARGQLPVLIEEADIFGDLHMHTEASDGTATIERMREQAGQLGRRYIAITDHSRAMSVANGLDERRLRAQVQAIRRANAAEGPVLLAGIEVDIMPDGTLDLDLELLSQLDWVVASVHSELSMSPAAMTRRLEKALETGVVDCLGHPTGRRIGRREAYHFDFDCVLATARRVGAALECNANPGRLDLDGVACRQARDAGVLVATNSDAHSPQELSQLRLGVYTARRGWLEAKDVLNCWPIERLVSWRRERLRRCGFSAPTWTVRSAAGFVASDSPGIAAGEIELLRQSMVTPLNEEQRRRLEAFLRGGADAELAAALGDGAMQRAFELLTTGDGDGA